jgi:hypothetical protein
MILSRRCDERCLYHTDFPEKNISHVTRGILPSEQRKSDGRKFRSLTARIPRSRTFWGLVRLRSSSTSVPVYSVILARLCRLALTTVRLSCARAAVTHEIVLARSVEIWQNPGWYALLAGQVSVKEIYVLSSEQLSLGVPFRHRKALRN